MPFKSEAQRKFMYSQHPAIAKRWSAEYPHQGQLPEHVADKKKEHHKTAQVKVAYEEGIVQALYDLGLTKQAAANKETRLKKYPHPQHEFFSVKRTFERSQSHKKENGHEESHR